MLSNLLWRLWKWILHCLTGTCELYRICLSERPVHTKTQEIVESLRLSRVKVLSDTVERLGVDLSVDSAVSIVVKEKAIKPSLQQEFVTQLATCLTRVSGVQELWVRVEEIRAESYQQTNQAHEAALLELWNHLMPGQQLTDRISKQWQEIGFQGNNPATDFRGMGMLGLRCLLYFSTRHCDKARSVLLQSKHPQHWYPFAVVGIDLTGVLHCWLKDSSSKFYSITSEWPPTPSAFMEMFCVLFYKFNSFWVSEKPENIMAFPRVKAKFLEHLKSEISENKVTWYL